VARGGKERKPARGALAAALIAACAALPPPAHAGAWTQPEGDGVLIVSGGRQTQPISAMASGIAESDKTSMQIYAEYGLIDGLTLGAAVFGEIDTTDLISGSASVSAFARKRIWQDDDGYVASVQIGGSLPFESVISDVFGESKPDSTPEVTAAFLGGTGWWGDWGSAFVSGGAGYAWRSEGAANEIRSELTLGYEPWRCCLALLGVYGAMPLGGRGTGSSLTVSPSLAYRVWPEVWRNGVKPPDASPATVQIGLSYDVLGGDEGIGLTFAVWREF